MKQSTLALTLVVVVAFVSLALVAAAPSSGDNKQEVDPKKTFFGVDVNDAEAMKKKHEELSEENARRLFGDDHQLDQIDFSPNFDSKAGEHIRAAHEKFSNFIKGMLEAFLKPNPGNKQGIAIEEIPSTTETPSTTAKPLMQQ